MHVLGQCMHILLCKHLIVPVFTTYLATYKSLYLAVYSYVIMHIIASVVNSEDLY